MSCTKKNYKAKHAIETDDPNLKDRKDIKWIFCGLYYSRRILVSRKPRAQTLLLRGVILPDKLRVTVVENSSVELGQPF
jgi:hypothetical protein